MMSLRAAVVGKGAPPGALRKLKIIRHVIVIANSDSQSGVPGLNLYQETYNSGFPQTVQRLR
jgi:hypothetical protein